MSALENETLHDTTTFDYFDRKWTIPAKRHLSHAVKMRDEIRRGYTDYNLLVAETFLDADQFAELLKVDPDDEQLDGFVKALGEAMGVGDKGNS